LRKKFYNFFLNRFLRTNFEELNLFDVTSFLSEIDLSFLEVIRDAPVWMSRAERLLLFSLIFCLRPSSYLEIGTFKGGSALIVSSAMDASGNGGRMVCIDPDPQIEPTDWEKIKHRVSLVKGFSPDIITKAIEFIEYHIDFALIDGDHRADSVLHDGCALLPFASKGTYFLFHDCFNPEVQEGIQSFLRKNSKKVLDCGILTREYTKEEHPGKNPTRWGGMRLVRIVGSP
jgi:hypothetical protein